MDISKDFIIQQLELQAQHFESLGDNDSAKQVRDVINKASKRTEENDSTFLDVDLSIRIDKYDGEIKDGDKPVESILFNKYGEKQCL